MKRIICAIIATIVLTSGCIMKLPPPLTEETRLQIRTIAVVPAPALPESSFDASAMKGKEAGAAAGAGGGAIQGGLTAVVKLFPVAILYPPTIVLLAGIGAVGGAAGGYKDAIPADVVQKIDALSAGAVAKANPQKKLAGTVEKFAKDQTNYRVVTGMVTAPAAEEKPDYRSLAGQGVDLVVETGVIGLGFTGGKGDDPTIQFFMTAGVRALKPGEAELSSGSFPYYSMPGKASDWIRDGDARIEAEMEKAYAYFAARITETLFLKYDMPLAAEGWEYPSCALNHIDPPPLPKRSFGVKAPVTASLQPVLQWESFSGGNKGDDITYDLIVSKVRSLGYGNYFPGETVYAKRGLTAPERTVEAPAPAAMAHTPLSSSPVRETPLPVSPSRPVRIAEHAMEVTLEPLTEYSWSVRARFKFDGQSREANWSTQCVVFGDPVTIFHRFKTPDFELPGKAGADANVDAEILSPSLAALRGASPAEYKTPDDVEGKTFYTATNIWRLDADKILSSNYHQGEMIPLGTSVRITRVIDKTIVFRRPSIDFVDDTGQSYTIVFATMHAKKGTTTWDIFKQYFTESDPLGEGGVFNVLMPEERSQVKNGRIAEGMSKAAVVMAYGHPYGTETPSLEGNKWIYLETQRGQGREHRAGRRGAAPDKARTSVYFIDDRVVKISR